MEISLVSLCVLETLVLEGIVLTGVSLHGKRLDLSSILVQLVIAFVSRVDIEVFGDCIL